MTIQVCLWAIMVLGGDGPLTDTERTAIASIDSRAASLTQLSQQIWSWAELALEEQRSSKALADRLAQAGFELKTHVSGMQTAWIASYGSGQPVVAFLAEFDALPGLSQKATARVEPELEGAAGHGCGHNLFGVASVGAALGLKDAMERHGLKATIRVYGTPAEEQGIGKVFMVRDKWFNDVDVCFSWHPGNENKVNTQPTKALRSFEVTFYGRSAHAAREPWQGVSALDAVEAFETGINLLREHIPESGRIHYIVTDGGAAPNIVPAKARIWLFTRGKDWPEQEQIYRHVEAMVKAADMMAWGEEYGDESAGFKPAQIQMYTGLYHYNINRTAGRVVQRSLEKAGAPEFTDGEQDYAKSLQTAFGVESLGFHTSITPLDYDQAPESTYSTDVANISWVAPTVGFSVANWPRGIPMHSWASTSASGYSSGYRAMHQASKVMALSAIQVINEPGIVKAIREEFEASREGFPYSPALGPDAVPMIPSR